MGIDGTAWGASIISSNVPKSDRDMLELRLESQPAVARRCTHQPAGAEEAEYQGAKRAR